MEHLIRKAHLYALLTLFAFAGCREEIEILPAEKDVVGGSQENPETTLTGFYLLNEGNMGSNKASLDLFTFADGVYSRNIYASANPDVPKELGDVGNDMKRCGDKLWISVNCSNKVEVLDLRTARRVGQVDIPNCRYLAFDGGYAYVTSYAGPVEINPDYTQRGFVARIDTLTLQETARVTVGFQPDGIAITGGKIYVANSGGYLVPNYEDTLSVIDLATMKAEETIEIGINLNLVVAAPDGRLWVTSRGDYFDTPGKLYVYDPAERRIVKEFDQSIANLWLHGNKLYAISGGFSYLSGEISNRYLIFNTSTLEIESDCFITDGTETEIRVPYGIAVNPATEEIYITDAGNYVNPGHIRCYSPSGRHLWAHRTGDIPKSLVFF